MDKQDYKKQLLKIITEKRRELQSRKSRLKYNITAGVNRKAIKAQRETIQEIETQLDNLEYMYQRDMYDIHLITK